MIQANINNRWAQLSQNEKAELLGIYASQGWNDLANIIAHYNSCGGKLYGNGGPGSSDGGVKFFRASTPDETPMMYEPPKPYPVVVPPNDYPWYGPTFREFEGATLEYPSSTGMLEKYPIPTSYPQLSGTYVESYPGVAAAAVDLFSDEAKTRRKMKQRYAESAFNDKARSKAGAQGAWQIMPITLKDYLGRGRGKAGDLNDPVYNEKVRDWVMGIIPRDLQEFWSEDDTPINKLAKLYAAYNWGAGSLRGYLRKRQKAGLSIDDPYEWVEGLNPETRRYVKYLAFDEDIPDSTYTNDAFEAAAAKRGYTFKRGGKKKNGRFSNAVLKAAMADNPAVMTASGWRIDKDGDVVQDSQDEPGVKRLRNSLEQIAYIPFGDMAAATAGAAITGTKAYRGWKLARELNKITKAGVVDDAVDAAKNTLMYEPGRIPSGTYYGFVDTVDDISMIPEPVGAGYSGYTPTSQSKEGARFVTDVDEAVKMAEARGRSHVKLDELDSSLEKKLGEKIGGGVEHTVYQHPDDPDRVIKIAKLGEDTKEYAIDAAMDQLARTDKLYEMPLSLEGVMRYPEIDQWVPVYSQQKLTTLPKAPSEALADKVDDFARRIGTEPYYGASNARINNVFLENVGPMGYSPSEGWYEIRPSEYKDFHPDNIGFTKDGFLMGFDLRRNGGRIHIKPENRGKFTALKKRTGHSASWFKAHGTPAQKKMATFALNARKWKHEDGGPLANYLDDGGPYGVIPLGGDYLTYLQNIPEVSGGMIEPSVVTAALPAKFNGSQAAAARYAEGYQKGAKPVSEAMNRAGQKIFNTVDTVIGLTPTPAGAITWLGHMGADTANGEYGKVGKDLAMAAAMGLGLHAAGRGVTFLKNYWDDIGRFGEDTFRAFTEEVPSEINANLRNMIPASKSATAAAAAAKTVSPAYEIESLGGGYMLKSLMRGSPLEKQISKDGTVAVGNVRALIGKGSKVEQAVVDKVLASDGFAGKKRIDYNDFRRAVQNELIAYERKPSESFNSYGIDRLLPEPKDLSTPGMYGPAKLETYTFSSSRIPNGSDAHYSANTLGHSRTYTTADEPNVLHVMESQSDWAQGGVNPRHSFFDSDGRDISDEVVRSWTAKRTTQVEGMFDFDSRFYVFGDTPEERAEFDKLMREFNELNERVKTGDYRDYWKLSGIMRRLNEIATIPHEGRRAEIKTPHLRPGIEERIASQGEQERYLSDTYTSRQIQENLRYAAEKGQTKMRYPTRETAAKVEGYTTEEAYFDATGKRIDFTFSDIEDIYTYGEKKDRKIEILKKEKDELLDMLIIMEDSPERESVQNRVNKISELLSDLRRGRKKLKPGIERKKVYENEDILRRYSEFPKQFRKLFKGADVRTVTDSNGNTWYEIDVPENYLQQEWAYKYGGPLKQFADFSGFF